MTLLSKFDAHVIERSKKFRVYIEIGDVTRINALIEKLESEYNARDLLVTVPRSGGERMTPPAKKPTQSAGPIEAVVQSPAAVVSPVT